MLRFLINLFNIGKKRINKERYVEGNTEIVVDKLNGEMIIRTSKKLTDEDILYFFKKYILGEY